MKNFKSNHSCIACGERKDGFVTFHHVYTQKAYPEFKTETWNLMPLCSWCHVEVHKIGTVSFAKKYKEVNNWLIENNWELLMGKWRH